MTDTLITTNVATGEENGLRRRFTVAEFERLLESGIFSADERLELIEGRIQTKMTQNSAHATAIRLGLKLLLRIVPLGYEVSVQLPLVLSEDSRPEPDLYVSHGEARDYTNAHPTTAVLVVEVADSSLLTDRTRKGGLYARAGIPEYWIINLAARVVEVLRQPVPMPSEPFGYAYRSLTRFSADETLPLPFAPETTLSVADLLP